MCLLSGVDTCLTVSFWTEKLTEVLILSFSKPQVPYVIRMKAQGAKNKVFKSQIPIKCLTLKPIGHVHISHMAKISNLKEFGKKNLFGKNFKHVNSNTCD